MVEFNCNQENLKDELKLLINLFNTEKINKIDFNLRNDNGAIICTIDIFKSKSTTYKFNNFIENNELQKRKVLRFAKTCLYVSLSKYLHQKLTWGSLTGIRPQKIYKEILDDISDTIPYTEKIFKSKKEFMKHYFVSNKKAEIVKQIFLTQDKYVQDDKKVHLYVNIPFCPTRCYYCSFVACGIDKFAHLVEPYLESLLKEIDETIKYLKLNNYEIASIYVGGGTPTSLNNDQLRKLLNVLSQIKVNEYTVEAGRPDTISKAKLDVFKEFGVTRISINPQSFIDSTLVNIGRIHTANDIKWVYSLAKPYNFNINMDLIAGLDNESLTEFKYSLNECIKLNPTDITIHTLSIKNTSDLKISGGKIGKEKEVGKMVQYAYKKLNRFGYKPYYLYRQKNMLGNHENIGYTKKYCCSFNVISMDELATVVACGANAISKKLTLSTNKIERFANFKNITYYINRVDEIIESKINFLKL